MKRNLYLRVLKDTGWTLDGLNPIKGRHFYLKLYSDENGYAVEDGMYEITHACRYGELNRNKHEIYIDRVMQFVDKGYIELVEDPTDYSLVN